MKIALLLALVLFAANYIPPWLNLVPYAYQYEVSNHYIEVDPKILSVIVRHHKANSRTINRAIEDYNEGLEVALQNIRPRLKHRQTTFGWIFPGIVKDEAVGSIVMSVQAFSFAVYGIYQSATATPRANDIAALRDAIAFNAISKPYMSPIDYGPTFMSRITFFAQDGYTPVAMTVGRKCDVIFNPELPFFEPTPISDAFDSRCNKSKSLRISVRNIGALVKENIAFQRQELRYLTD